MSKDNKQKFILRSSSQLFFTTIAMVVLLVIGISTATFAWFSANSRVGSGAIVFEAKNTASANIYIGWHEDATTTSIEFGNPDQIAPMVPKFKPEDSNPIIEGTNNRLWANIVEGFYNSFYTSTTNVQQDENDPLLFNEPPTKELPYIGHNGEDATQQHFYIINGGTDSTNVSAQVLFEGENASIFRVALFVEGEHAGTIIPSDINPLMRDTHYGPIFENADASSDGFNKLDTQDTAISFALTEKYVKVSIICWFDGVYLTNEDADKTASISLVFRGTKS